MPTTPWTILNGIPAAEEAIPVARAAEEKEPLANAARPASNRMQPKLRALIAESH